MSIFDDLFQATAAPHLMRMFADEATYVPRQGPPQTFSAAIANVEEEEEFDDDGDRLVFERVPVTVLRRETPGFKHLESVSMSAKVDALGRRWAIDSVDETSTNMSVVTLRRRVVTRRNEINNPR